MGGRESRIRDVRARDGAKHGYVPGVLPHRRSYIHQAHTHTHRQTNQAHTGTLLKRPTKDFVQHGPLTFWNLQA